MPLERLKTGFLGVFCLAYTLPSEKVIHTRRYSYPQAEGLQLKTEVYIFGHVENRRLNCNKPAENFRFFYVKTGTGTKSAYNRTHAAVIAPQQVNESLQSLKNQHSNPQFENQRLHHDEN